MSYITENVDQDNKLKAAVVAQLAKPEIKPLAAAFADERFEVLVMTCLGIVGGALTLLTNLGAVLMAVMPVATVC